MNWAAQWVLEIYARIPLVPQSLFVSGHVIQIDDERMEGYNIGTLASGKREMKVLLWDHSYGIHVCYTFSPAAWNINHICAVHVSKGACMGNFSP